MIFTNNGNRATHLLDMRVLDADDNQVLSYKPPCDLVDPPLPANIEPGHAITFKLKITSEQTQRARWFEWEREGQVKERRPWTNRDLYIYVSAASMCVSAGTATVTVTAPVTRHPGRADRAAEAGKVGASLPTTSR